MNRKLSREKAMELLFSMMLTKESVEETLESFVENYEEDIKTLDMDFIRRILYGIEKNKEEIDSEIKDNLTNWRIERISKVNLSILRLGTYELKYDSDIPRNVAINEALEITRKYSDEKSVSFINGILDKIK